MTCLRGAKVCTKWLQGKNDDELIRHDNKMRIGTRSGIQKSGKSSIVYGLLTKHDADVPPNESMDSTDEFSLSTRMIGNVWQPVVNRDKSHKRSGDPISTVTPVIS